jgi:leucyl aminopeptidase (aminopeptidase T)
MVIDPVSGARRVVRMCGEAVPSDSALVIADEGTDDAVVSAFVGALEEVGCSVEVRRVRPADLSPDADPAEICRRLSVGFPTLLIGVGGASVYHSAFGRVTADRGGRVLALTGCVVDTLTSGAIDADFRALERPTLDLASRLSAAERLELTTAAGTRLVASLRDRPGHACTALATTPGARTGCPDVEAFIAPVEASVEGVVVVDGSSTTLGLVDAPITITVERGRAVAFEGGDHASHLASILRGHGAPALQLAEFGFGMNPEATLVGRIIEDEGMYGTGHVALGDNVTFGGVNSASIHVDLVYYAPTLLLDGEPIFSAGVLEVPGAIA